ncbi:MAG TPA: DnaJ domain-containing protein, partial [Cyanophyceae cyanobacterium]
MNTIHRYYEILGLQPGASQADIKQAYRNLAKNWHPDRFSDAPQLKQKAEEEIKKINEAYQYLKSYQPNSPNQTSSSTIHTDSFNAETYY